METKRCPMCGETKPGSEFGKNSSRKDGLQSVCKACRYLVEKRWREANPEKVRERHKRWRDANPEKIREKNRKWHEANSDKVRERDKRSTEDLIPAYVAATLKLPTAQLTPELLEAKREQLLNARALRELTKTLKELNHVE